MKKILIFSLAYYPKHVGGAEVALQQITNRVPDDEIEFHMVTNRFDSTLPRHEMEGNVLVHRIGITTKNPSMSDLKKWPLKINKGLFQFYAGLYALYLHRKYRYDGIWAMMAHATGAPSALFNLFAPKPFYLLTLQEGDPIPYIEKKMKPVWPLFKRSFTRADHIQAISTFLGGWAKARQAKCPIDIIPNAVDMQKFTKEFSEAEISEVQKAIGKKEGEIWMIHTGRFVTKNALDDVVAALKFLPKEVHVFLIGEGPDRALYEEIAKKDGSIDRVHFHPYVHVDEIPKYLKACDIFIRPSRSEGMGNSFVEAMAARVPVIATQEGGIADFLFDAKRNPEVKATGWAVDTNSPEQIAEAVKDILLGGQKKEDILNTAKALVISKYDWDIIARDMREKIFSRI
jgi:glycosyltransferase involved in cell wall biosynthesis